MTTNRGNGDHGPGGDPSWLGGTDRARSGSQGGGGFSSDFAPDAQAPSADFGPRHDQQAAEEMAPQFGERGTLPSEHDEGSPWSAGFTSNDSGRADDGGFNAGRAFRKCFPILVLVIVAVFGFRMLSGNFSLWFLVLFLIPFVRNAVSIIRNLFKD
ncbi:hypothetical protein CFK41_16045 [Brachybacterium ginsengisoli]|uniref:Uncharacterized protein n=1 Tax=Brachybacterium ginsengisoli TaxID=1331682 RepID=A0A291H0W2_9MICO|nr:hypothetical protein [Brachybacterium ginsengisoli]ATG56119.1 hypothetical protein CFK41_16045 [Brachybacterium ginsengisoli]